MQQQQQHQQYQSDAPLSEFDFVFDQTSSITSPEQTPNLVADHSDFSNGTIMHVPTLSNAVAITSAVSTMTMTEAQPTSSVSPSASDFDFVVLNMSELDRKSTEGKWSPRRNEYEFVYMMSNLSASPEEFQKYMKFRMGYLARVYPEVTKEGGCVPPPHLPVSTYSLDKLPRKIVRGDKSIVSKSDGTRVKTSSTGHVLMESAFTIDGGIQRAVAKDVQQSERQSTFTRSGKLVNLVQPPRKQVPIPMIRMSDLKAQAKTASASSTSRASSVAANALDSIDTAAATSLAKKTRNPKILKSKNTIDEQLAGGIMNVLQLEDLDMQSVQAPSVTLSTTTSNTSTSTTTVSSSSRPTLITATAVSTTPRPNVTPRPPAALRQEQTVTSSSIGSMHAMLASSIPPPEHNFASVQKQEQEQEFNWQRYHRQQEQLQQDRMQEHSQEQQLEQSRVSAPMQLYPVPASRSEDTTRRTVDWYSLPAIQASGQYEQQLQQQQQQQQHAQYMYQTSGMTATPSYVARVQEQVPAPAPRTFYPSWNNIQQATWAQVQAQTFTPVPLATTASMSSLATSTDAFPSSTQQQYYLHQVHEQQQQQQAIDAPSQQTQQSQQSHPYTPSWV